MVEAAAPELELVARAKRERWNVGELRTALLCALPTLTEGEVERLVEAARLNVSPNPAGRGPLR